METTVSLCKCTECDEILINPNPQPEAKLYKVEKGKYRELKTSGENTQVCPKCKDDYCLTDEVTETIITASICLYYSTSDKAHYMQVITAREQQHIFLRITKVMAEDISKENLLEIEETSESFKN